MGAPERLSRMVLVDEEVTEGKPVSYEEAVRMSRGGVVEEYTYLPDGMEVPLVPSGSRLRHDPQSAPQSAPQPVQIQLQPMYHAPAYEQDRLQAVPATSDSHTRASWTKVRDEILEPQKQCSCNY
jgi:hypothetical protein